MDTVNTKTLVKKKFFVYIVESPKPADLYNDITEGKSLSESLRLSGIESTYRLAVSLDQFKLALGDGLVDAVKHQNKKPIIHISAHGDSEGIVLTDNTSLDWAALRIFFLRINKGLKGIFLCLSSCQGYSGQRMSMFDDDDYPFAAIIANGDRVSYADTNIGYAVFYHLFAKGYEPEEAVKVMREASGNNRFFLETGVEARQGYHNYLKSQQLASLQTQVNPQVKT